MNDLKHLVRKRLNSLLSAIDTSPLTIVEAPAGYGKTTAVKDFLAKRQSDALWLSFQRLRGIPEVWSRFIKEIGKRDTATGKKLEELGLPIDIPKQEKALSILSNLELKHSTVVVFDNYELSTEKRLAEFLLWLGEEEIENFHLVVLTRDTTEFNLAVSLARKRCCVISREQLRFTEDEMREYCTLFECQIDSSRVRELITYADGWISLLYVMLAGMEQNIPIGLNPTLDELINQNLFQVHSHEIRHYLLQLSIMDGFTAKQADYVTERWDSADLLWMLRKKNAFIQYDELEQIYRIHPVLVDFLRVRREFTKEEERGLYCRLGEWLIEKGDLPQGYTCLAKAEEAERIIIHMNRQLPGGQLYTDFEGADKVFASVPEKILFENPIAYLRYLFYAVISDKKAVISVLPQKLDELEAYYHQKSVTDEKGKNHILGEILCVRKFTAFNDMPLMHAYNNEILRLLQGKQSLIMLEENEFTFGVPHYLYVYFREEGTLESLVELSQHAEYTAFSSGNGLGVDSLARAEHACETGDFQAALLESRKAVYKAETRKQHSVMICARFCGARVSLALGQIQTARDLLQLLREDAQQQSNPVYLSMARLCEGYLYASLEMQLPQWLKEGRTSSLNLFFGGMGFDKLVCGKALLAQGEYLKLEALADSFDEAFAVFQNRLGLLHGTILRAAAKVHLYGTEAAVPLLIRALDMARPDGIILPFAECARHLLPVFRALPKKVQTDAFVCRVKETCMRYREAVLLLLPEDRSLTPREMEVLQLLDMGLTRNQIADRLFISPSTVKFHLRIIYQKLDASSKVSALRTARLNGLI